MLSLCLIVCDEEELLPGCLAAAAPVADEIVVVDTGSTDRSASIAADSGACVLHLPWTESFADARNAALDAALGDWVLFLDADEHLVRERALEIRELLGRGGRDAFLFPMFNLTGDGSTSTTHPALRLWRNRPTYRYEGRIHERLVGLPLDRPERFELVDIPVVHHGYLARVVADRRKTARNLALLQLEAREAPGPYTSFNLGSEYLRLADWPRAAEHLDEAWLAICGEPEWESIGFAPLLAVRAGRARRELGRLEAARGLLGVALERLPDYTDLVYELAACAVAAGDRAEAERLLKRCLELGDAPLPYAGTVGAGTHLARAFLEALRAA
jgi:tetratricopeptide (TPR) repeat protein